MCVRGMVILSNQMDGTNFGTFEYVAFVLFPMKTGDEPTDKINNEN